MSDLSDSAIRPLPSLASMPAVATGTQLQSPSLFGQGSEADAATAFEVKYLLSEEQVREVCKRLDGKLALDPYADPALNNAYPIMSLYTDTPAFDVFYRTENYNRDKYRVRRYGATGPVFVERKTKNGDKVRKHRSRIALAEVSELATTTPHTEWAGDWFHTQLQQLNLRPVCRIAYERIAYLGTADGGVVRLTFDRNIRGIVTNDWMLEPVSAIPPLLTDRVVCEMKFRTTMPTLFKGIVADLALTPTPMSKYRTFVQTAGLAPALAPARDANV